MSDRIGDYILMEGYCYAPTDTYPCGKDGVSAYCMYNGMCPYFDPVEADLRTALLQVPVWRTIIDRIVHYSQQLWWQVMYSLGFGKKDLELMKEFVNALEKDIAENAPEIITDQQDKLKEFKEWQEEVEKEGESNDGSLSNMW